MSPRMSHMLLRVGGMQLQTSPGSEELVLESSEVWVLVMMLLEHGSEKDWCSAQSGLKPTSVNRVLMDCSHTRSFAYPSVTSFMVLLK